MEVEGIDHVALFVKDLDVSTAWYERMLGLQRRYEDVWPIPVMLGAGSTGVALFAARSSAPEDRPSGRVGFSHLAFRVDRAGFEDAKRLFESESIPFEFQDHDVSHSIYFEDPDGNQIEITTYELDA